MHGLGHVKPDAAHQVHHVHEHVQVDHRIAVHVEADQVSDLGLQPVDGHTAGVGSPGVDRVDLSHVPVQIDKGVPGDAHKVHGMVHGIQAAHNDGIGVAVSIVIAHQQDGIAVLLPVGADGLNFAVRILFNGYGLGCLRLHVRSLFPQHIYAVQGNAGNGKDPKQRKKGAEKQAFIVFFLMHIPCLSIP